MDTKQINQNDMNQIKAVFQQLQQEICFEEHGEELLQRFKSSPLQLLQERGLSFDGLPVEIKEGLANSLSAEIEGVPEPITGQTKGTNEFWTCWFCTKGMEVAITVPISLGGAALFAGGEIALGAIEVVAPGVALILGLSLAAAKQVITSLVTKVQDIPALVNQLAVMACEGMGACS